MKPIRAFAVTETDENTGGIIFARHAITATRIGADEYGTGEIHGMSCRRAKWADQFADTGRVPASEMIARGWHFECHGCGSRIDEDELRCRGLSVDGVVGTQNSWVFCGARCRLRHLAQLRREKMCGDAFLEVLRGVIRKRFGNVHIHEDAENFKPHVYVISDRRIEVVGQAAVYFDFPGMQIGPASIHYDWPYSFAWDGKGPVKPHFRCCNGDREAFEKFAEETKL